jgi:hypothetical protein
MTRSPAGSRRTATWKAELHPRSRAAFVGSIRPAPDPPATPGAHRGSALRSGLGGRHHRRGGRSVTGSYLAVPTKYMAADGRLSRVARKPARGAGVGRRLAGGRKTAVRYATSQVRVLVPRVWLGRPTFPGPARRRAGETFPIPPRRADRALARQTSSARSAGRIRAPGVAEGLVVQSVQGGILYCGQCGKPWLLAPRG